MSFDFLRKIPTVGEIKDEMPFTDNLRVLKEKRDQEVMDIYNRKSSKMLLIIGPCSADNEDAVLEYIARLSKLQSKVAEKLVLIPRVYTNKPRTTGEGYKGMFHQPDVDAAPDLLEGLKKIRKMHLRFIGETGLTAADEVLYPDNSPYLDELVSYITIGARSVENQQHRLVASGFSAPVGMKNPTSGDLNVLLNSINAAQLPHKFVYNGWEVTTSGNPIAHAILRGAVDRDGQNIPNYHYESLVKFVEKYTERGLSNPTVIVDTNHSNSGKRFDEQPRIAMDVINSIRKSDLLRDSVKGFMIESYLVGGSQDPTGDTYGQSITDPCLGWEDTETLVQKIAEYI